MTGLLLGDAAHLTVLTLPMLRPAGATILPLLSQAQPRLVLPDDKAKALMTRIQNAGTEVVEAKVGPHSAS